MGRKSGQAVSGVREHFGGGVWGPAADVCVRGDINATSHAYRPNTRAQADPGPRAPPARPLLAPLTALPSPTTAAYRALPPTTRAHLVWLL